MIVELTKKEFLESYDWDEVFGDGMGGNCANATDECPPGAKIDTSPPKKVDVEEIIALVNGENDGDDWLGIFLLKDGRYLFAKGGCNYTGWECQASSSFEVALSLDDIIQYGLNEEEKKRLGVSQ